jgi:hypothetical protein
MTVALSPLALLSFVLSPMPCWFLLVGPAYCLCLSAFAVGVTLAGPRAMNWWLLSGVIPWLGALGFWLLILQSDPQTLIPRIGAVAPVVQAIVVVWLASGVALAVFGWVRYLRAYRSDSESSRLEQ